MFALVTLELKKRYPGLPAILIDVFALFMSLGIYYFAAKSFAQDWRSYFLFLTIGETALYAPIICFYSVQDTLKMMNSERTLEYLMTVKRPLWITLTEFALAAAIREWIRAVLIIIIAVVVTKSDLPLNPATWIAAQVFAIPSFLGLGFISTALWLRFRRGDGAVALLNSMAIFVSGAYFPTTALPSSVSNTLKYLSPYNAVIDSVRAPSLGSLSALIGLGLIFAGAGTLLFRYSNNWVRRTGSLPF